MADINRRKGGSRRAYTARVELVGIFSKPEDNTSLLKDIEYAKQFDVTRHTIAAIRKQFNIPGRTVRILNRLRTLETKELTLYEISDILGVKYQNLYKIVKENSIDVKADIKPIEHLKRHAKDRKMKSLELINNSGILTDIEKQLEDINIIQPPSIERIGF